MPGPRAGLPDAVARVRRLPDGRLVRLRPVAAADGPALEALLMGLSPVSRRLRFHGAVNALPAPVLHDLVAPGDDHHVTWVAEAACADGRRRLVAEARWVRERPGATAAEFALSVADDWRRQGLARALLERLLASASQAGVRTLHGSVLDENRAMLALLGAMGARPRRDPRAGHGLVWTFDTEPRPAAPGAAAHRATGPLAWPAPAARAA